MPRFVVSGLGLHCLPVIHLGVSSLHWVKRLYLLHLWMEIVHTCPDVRYWSEVICCSSSNLISDFDCFWLKFLEAKRDSGELLFPATNLIVSNLTQTSQIFYVVLTKCSSLCPILQSKKAMD